MFTCRILIFLLVTPSICYAQENDTSPKSENRNDLIDVILGKIRKISSDSIQNATEDGDKDFELIEAKLRKAAEPLGEKGEKYVKMLMRGIRSGKHESQINIIKKNVTVNDNVLNITEAEGQPHIELHSNRKSSLDGILNKIHKIYMESVNDAASGETENILKSIENKLKTVAISLGEKGEKYVNLIMRGIRQNISKKKSLSDAKRRFYDKLETGKPRNTMLNYVVERIGKLTLESFNQPSNENEDNKLRLIENKLRIAAQPLGNKGDKYIELIMRAVRSNKKKGLKQKIKDAVSEETDQIVENAIKLNNVIKIDANNLRLRNQAVKDIAKSVEKAIRKYSKMGHNEKLIEEIKRKTFESMQRNGIIRNNKSIRVLSDLIVDGINTALLNIHNYKKIKQLEPTMSTTKKLPNLVKRCMGTLNKTCRDIQYMKSFKCLYVYEIIPISKICDGENDCPDGSDERQCGEKALGKLRFAHEVLSALDISLEHECFTTNININILSKQNSILRDVLKAQLKFIERYKPKDLSDLNLEEVNEQTKSTMKEITDLITTLSMALEKVLCSKDSNGNLRRFNAILEAEDKIPWPVDTWPPKDCVCPDEICKNCTYPCKRICWHKSSLSRWNCDAVNGSSLVPLSVICDGKFDCYDESDEKGCFSENSYGKFQAHKTFSEILDTLKLKANKEYKSQSGKMWNLIKVVTSLEKISLDPNPSATLLKDHRDECFALLSEIYSDLLKRTLYASEAEELYDFLLSINQQLIAILKRIGTGNKKILTGGCFCRSGKCATSYCTRKCEKSCSVEDKLTRYNCEGSNKIIDIDNICNGINNCPREDDERHCNKEVCRSHHLTVLRHKVQDVGLKQKGTSMGEVISSWKTKVIGTLKVAERAGKPSQKIIKDIIKEILRDLVSTFGSVEDYRRKDNNYALQEFTSIADTVLSAARSCSN